MKFFLVLFCFLAVSFSSHAQLTLTWTGGGASDNWSDANNWDGVNTPDATHNILVFDGSTRTTPFNDLSGLTINQIQFASTASSFTLSGNSFTLGSGTAPANTIVNMGQFVIETINNAFTLGSNQGWTGSGIFSVTTVYNGNINNNGFTITTLASNGANHYIAGNISGTGGFVADANGNTSLYGNNTYTGPTTGAFSFFTIAGSVTSDVTTNIGGYLFSNGTINGNLSANGGSFDALRINSGLLTVNGNVSINGTSHEEWILGALADDFTGGVAGTQWGEILVNGGNFTYDPNGTFDIILGVSNPDLGNPFWSATRRWLVGSVNSGSLNFSGDNLGFNNYAAGYFFLEQQGNNLYLNWQVAPEPSSFALIGLAVIFSSAAISRRKKLHKDVK